MPEMKRLSDEEIIGDFCKTCEYSLEGCIEHGQQSTCASYKEALRQKKGIAQTQLEADQKVYREVIREMMGDFSFLYRNCDCDDCCGLTDWQAFKKKYGVGE